MNRLYNIIIELSAQLVRLEQANRELEFTEGRMKHHRPNIDTDPWAMNFYMGAYSRTVELIEETIVIQERINQLEIQLRESMDERKRGIKAKMNSMPTFEVIALDGGNKHA